MNWTLKLATVAAVSSLAVGTAHASFIAYDNAPVAPNQGFGNSLGMDFSVGSTPIVITALGAFDSGIAGNLAGVDGSSGVTVQIYSSTGVAQGASVNFNPITAGVPINGDAFLPIAPLVLPAGFKGVVVAFNDINYNSFGGPNGTSIEDGGGLITFTGTSQYLGGFQFPTTIDGGPENRYDAGTFEFSAVPEASTYIAGAMLLLPFGLSAVRRFRKQAV
jgi:hypothetical protein